MKRTMIIIACLTVQAGSTNGQGWFDCSNAYARTWIGSLDGPLAGSGIWAQMLVGPTSESLVPIGVPVEHDPLGIGLADGGFIQVPGIPPCGTAYLRMVAWDGVRWGTSLAGVPATQFGATDTVPVRLGGPIFTCDPIPIPFFRQPAVVPVPEPSGLAIAAVCGLVCLAFLPFRTTPERGRGGVTPLAEN